jgi:hypothetical protein
MTHANKLVTNKLHQFWIQKRAYFIELEKISLCQDVRMQNILNYNSIVTILTQFWYNTTHWCFSSILASHISPLTTDKAVK